ncbi:uncharacterized protein BO96DRAFT_136707 [Aspergillus niger CBS 101883]|uniref:uncharacterized protein n=1 Tax=Aspergillus lacticoffeatus (strain CBS 101883) TaxID=1450533 RepID=UPI000D7F8B73|nr:uncharacterized protein BO96DRAFT_136707 [Aspergillus niger CBS 101883]PYH52944.1 hypothetical protein BO96DRAFT_136707 [Aspergillus niger CBS 101883]
MYKMHTNIPYRHGHRSPRKLPVWGVLDRQGIRYTKLYSALLFTFDNQDIFRQ